MKIISRRIFEKLTNTVGERNEVDEVMAFVLFIQRILGQKILDPSWTLSKFLHYHVFWVALIIYVIFGTVDFIENTKDLRLIAEAGFTFVIIFIFPIKYAFFVLNKSVFRELYSEVKTTLFEAIKKNSDDEGRRVMNKLKRGVRLFFGLTICPLTLYIFKAMWFYLHGERITLSKTTTILMPMQTPYHEIGLILHALFMILVACTHILSDVWFVILTYFFCVSIDTTKNTLNVSSRSFVESESEYSNRLNEGLRNFYDAHVKQVEYLYKMNVMFRWLGLLPLLYVTLSACLMFLLLSMGVDWTFAANTLPVFAELFVFNWFGEQIKVKMQELNIALLDFDWTSLELKDKRSYFIIVSYMNKQFSLRTAIGTDLSLITMSDVLKVSYQACTVLQTMDG